MKSRRNFLVTCLAVAVAAPLVFFWFSPSNDFSVYYHPYPPPSTPPSREQNRPSPHDGESRPQPGRVSHEDAAAAFANFTASDRPLMPTDDPLCAQLPGLDSSIVLIVKTGATEAFGKVPTQLQTILRCVPDLLIFSDMEQTIAGVHVRDSLDTVLDSVKEGSDFALYHAQKACLVSQGDCTRHRDKGKEGWNMDKYKNIHIAEKAYGLRPGRDWYVVIDADTYLFWTTLVALLARIDPTKKLLLGSIAHYQDFAFAHGGSGYAISRGAMDAFVGEHPGIGNMYDERVTEECCGDWMFSKAMYEVSEIPVTETNPTINGDKVWDMAFGPTHWCHPLATMHHVGSEEMSVFWEFEMKHHLHTKPTPSIGQPRPVLIRDMYLEYFVPRFTDQRDDWNNASKDVIYLNRTATDDEKDKVVSEEEKSVVERAAHTSLENCRKACEANAECFQFSYFYEGKCALGKSFKIGYPTKHAEEPKERQTSAWLGDRIKAWVSKQGDCKDIQWPEAARNTGILGVFG